MIWVVLPQNILTKPQVVQKTQRDIVRKNYGKEKLRSSTQNGCHLFKFGGFPTLVKLWSSDSWDTPRYEPFTDEGKIETLWNKRRVFFTRWQNDFIHKFY